MATELASYSEHCATEKQPPSVTTAGTASDELRARSTAMGWMRMPKWSGRAWPGFTCSSHPEIPLCLTSSGKHGRRGSAYGLIQTPLNHGADPRMAADQLQPLLQKRPGGWTAHPAAAPTTLGSASGSLQSYPAQPFGRWLTLLGAIYLIHIKTVPKPIVSMWQTDYAKVDWSCTSR